METCSASAGSDNTNTENTMIQYEKKIETLFKNFLQPQFTINNDVYFNSLLSHLAGKDNADFGRQLQNIPFLSEWLLQAITFWENNPKPSISVSSFTIQLAALLSSCEDRFLLYCTNNLYDRLCTIFTVRDASSNPSIKLAYIKMLTSFLDHTAGINWLTSSNHWQDCLKFCLDNQTIYIIKEGHAFIFKLLAKTSSCNETFATSVITELSSQLYYAISNNAFPEINEDMTKKLTPILNLVYYIFDTFFQSDYYKSNDLQLPKLLVQDSLIASKIDNLLLMAQDAHLCYELNRVKMAIHFLELNVRTETIIYARSDLIATGLKILDIINAQCLKNNVACVIKLGYLADYFWNFLKPRIVEITPEQGKTKPLLFQNQLIGIHLMPMFAVVNKYCKFKYNMEENELRDDFVQRLLELMSNRTIRFSYAWRNTIFDLPEVFECGKLATQYCVKSRKYFTRERALVFFQAFMYCLKDVIEAIKEEPMKVDVFKNQTGYLITLFEGVATYITEFEFTWRESVETICVTGCCIDFLKFPVWAPRLVVKILKLLNLSIARFMSPALALLVEPGDHDVTIKHLGPTMQNKLCDIDWEVRDSALEVIHTIANISNNKYPSFQKLLLELDLVRLVATMSSSDSQSYVRASAIKCLQQMIQVGAIWTQVLAGENLPEKMIEVLTTETEAIVRSEAAALLSVLYANSLIPTSPSSPNLMSSVYLTMATAATADLHWEVKTNALDFWGTVFLNHLVEQGFIDGSFPPITFSKENRKIVTLTEVEVQTRLVKVLQQLSRNGCLAVMVSAVQDDCDVEVAKKALGKMKKVQNLFNTHNFRSIDKSLLHSTLPTPTSPSCPQQYTSSCSLNTPPITPTVEQVDDVIEDIINSNDLHLLSDVYRREMLTNGRDRNDEKRQKLGVMKPVTPEEFVEFSQRDLDGIVAEKVAWLSKVDDFSSLLDDMICSCGDSSVNSMDCY